MTVADPTDPPWDAISYVIASKHRETVIEHLAATGFATPNQLATTTDTSQGSISHAISQLRDQGLVELLVDETRRKGRLYRLTIDGEHVHRYLSDSETDWVSTTHTDIDWDAVGRLYASDARRDVLQHLHHTGASRPTDIEPHVPHRLAHVSRALADLQDDGLLTVTDVDGDGRGRVYEPTMDGAKIAAHLFSGPERADALEVTQ